MKTYFKTRRSQLALILIGVLLVVRVGAAPFQIRDSVPGQRELTFELTQKIECVAVEDGWKVVCDGQTGDLSPGSPDLPAFAELLTLQPGESLSAKIVSATYDVVTQNVSVVAVPVRETVALDPGESITRMVRRKNEAIYALDCFWPEHPVRIDEAWQGPRKLARVELRPVQINPATGTVRVYRSLKVILRTVPSRDEEGPRGPIRRRPSTAKPGEGETP